MFRFTTLKNRCLVATLNFWSFFSAYFPLTRVLHSYYHWTTLTDNHNNTKRVHNCQKLQVLTAWSTDTVALTAGIFLSCQVYISRVLKQHNKLLKNHNMCNSQTEMLELSDCSSLIAMGEHILCDNHNKGLQRDLNDIPVFYTWKCM